MASDVLLENDFIRIEEHRALQVIVVRRSANKVEPAMIAAAYGEALATITPEHRSWGVVIDVRQTPGSNDAKFESAIGPVTERVGSSFARVVFLVRTAVGGLQMERLRRERGVVLLYTQDEAEAFALAAGSAR